MAKNQPIEVRLPCCGNDVKMTGRRVKQVERSRIHHCKKCGKDWAISLLDPNKPEVREYVVYQAVFGKSA